MPSRLFSSGGNREIRFMGVLRESPPLHFYLMQFTGFAYFLYRFLSRDYTVYGFVPDPMFNYRKAQTFLLYFTDLQFIYSFIPRPTSEVIYYLQWTVIMCCCLGLLGIFPKWNAVISFSIGLHITGMMQTSNSIIDGGTLALCLILILALSPSRCFYGFKNGLSISKRGVHYHWPVFLLFLLVGSYYTYAGLNKIIDIGPHWPFVFHLENLAAVGIERSIFVFNRYADPYVCSLHQSYLLSVFLGFATLGTEVSFISILFLPRYRLFLVVSMIVMHILVFLMAGINFVGSSLILLLCFDYNAIIRKLDVYYDDKCGFCLRSLVWVRRFDWFKRIRLIPISELPDNETELDINMLRQAMGVREENGEIYYGADGFEQISHRCPLLLPFGLVMKIPGAIYVSRWMYNIVATKRARLGSSCQLPR